MSNVKAITTRESEEKITQATNAGRLMVGQGSFVDYFLENPGPGESGRKTFKIETQSIRSRGTGCNVGCI
jgi:hypothetical protein